MNVEYHRWWSPSLQQDMEMNVYGWSGKPLLVFPAQGGRFYEYEDFGMIAACSPFIEAGKIKVFSVDSLDGQTWANWNAHPADRARRHADYDRYITQEVAPFVRQHCRDEQIKLLSSGVSMGGYHSVNFFFRHPDVFDALISLSGVMSLRMFVGGYMDENVYFNSPLDYLPGLEDEWYLQQYRQSQIIICVGQGAWEDAMLGDVRALQEILARKNIPAWIDYWGHDVNHDWPWWRQQMPYFLGKLFPLGE